MELGERIRTLRVEKGLSQEVLAGQLEVSRQAVAKWEGGQSRPSTANLLALCGVFGVSLDRLVAGEDASGAERSAWVSAAASPPDPTRTPGVTPDLTPDPDRNPASTGVPDRSPTPAPTPAPGVIPTQTPTADSDRRGGRWGNVVLLAVTLLSLVVSAAATDSARRWRLAESFIGGADGPTAILVTGPILDYPPHLYLLWGLTVVLAVVTAAALLRSRKRR